MSNSLAAALAAYAVENDLETVHNEQHGSPEEFPVHTDSTQSELELAVEDIAEDVAKIKDSGDVAEKLVDTIESMEGRIVLLQTMRQGGGTLNAASTREWVHGVGESLEARGFPVAWFEKDLKGLSTSMESNAYDYSTEAEGVATSLKTRATDALKKTYEAVVAFLKRIMDHFRGLGDSLAKAGDNLQKRSKELGSKSAKETHVKGSGFGLLYTAGGAFNPEQAIEASITAVGDSFKESAARVAHLTAKLATGGETPAASKIELTGGYVIEINEKGKASLKKEKEVKGDAEVAVATAASIGSIGKKLAALSLILHGKESDSKTLLAALDAIVKKSAAALDGQDKGEAKDANKLNIGEVQAHMKTVQSLVPLATGHAAKVGQAANRYALISAARYNGEAKAPESKPAAQLK